MHSQKKQRLELSTDVSSASRPLELKESAAKCFEGLMRHPDPEGGLFFAFDKREQVHTKQRSILNRADNKKRHPIRESSLQKVGNYHLHIPSEKKEDFLKKAGISETVIPVASPDQVQTFNEEYYGKYKRRLRTGDITDIAATTASAFTPSSELKNGVSIVADGKSVMEHKLKLVRRLVCHPDPRIGFMSIGDVRGSAYSMARGTGIKDLPSLIGEYVYFPDAEKRRMLFSSLKISESGIPKANPYWIKKFNVEYQRKFGIALEGVLEASAAEVATPVVDDRTTTCTSIVAPPCAPSASDVVRLPPPLAASTAVMLSTSSSSSSSSSSSAASSMASSDVAGFVESDEFSSSDDIIHGYHEENALAVMRMVDEKFEKSHPAIDDADSDFFWRNPFLFPTPAIDVSTVDCVEREKGQEIDHHPDVVTPLSTEKSDAAVMAATAATATSAAVATHSPFTSSSSRMIRTLEMSQASLENRVEKLNSIPLTDGSKPLANSLAFARRLVYFPGYSDGWIVIGEERDTRDGPKIFTHDLTRSLRKKNDEHRFKEGYSFTKIENFLVLRFKTPQDKCKFFTRTKIDEKDIPRANRHWVDKFLGLRKFLAGSKKEFIFETISAAVTSARTTLANASSASFTAPFWNRAVPPTAVNTSSNSDHELHFAPT